MKHEDGGGADWTGTGIGGGGGCSDEGIGEVVGKGAGTDDESGAGDEWAGSGGDDKVDDGGATTVGTGSSVLKPELCSVQGCLNLGLYEKSAHELAMTSSTQKVRSLGPWGFVARRYGISSRR